MSEEKTVKHYYLHADLDAFFASVEQLDHPEYRGKPVIVGGKPEDKRSVVSTASYEARIFGVHSAMPVAKAYQLCPQGIFVHGRMKRYSELSYQIMQIFADFSPDVQQMSIDEAFIDLTGTEKLFGPPEQTALKIKERVKNETGLTVSIGLAPTKYLAKLASDMKKPDGFYVIHEGTEQEFMLNLPLKKVWGIGDKTYEALRSSGLRTTRDIYEKTLDALTFMYGQNTGSFLYNVVRGIETVTFDRKTKSHSISNETTFPFDLTDIYTAETAMLELCHSVIFRLLKENGFSRTVQVKIRYEDFSTVSIQQTYPQSVLTLDTLYSAAKELFEKKYERQRGIRLLGIALENIEKTERSYQPGLFDDGNEKKQNVEKAILNFEKKHPEVKIHKARMLENISKGVKVLICALGLGIFCRCAHAQDYEISGSWTGKMKGSVNTTFGFGNPFGISAAPPVFDTEVDLSALIHITPCFYFQMEFLDKFYNNTYTFGYKGPGYLNEFKLSNRQITFPTYYSAIKTGYGISGGNNEAPGIMLHFTDFETNKWKGDFILRYDMTEQKTALFYGNNFVQDSTTELYNYVHSKSFVIPSDVIYHIKNIYVQSEGGTALSSDGINFYKLSSTDYIIDYQKRLLVLSDSVNNVIKPSSVPYILISFDDASLCQVLLNETGSYSDSSSFAGQLQAYFSSTVPDFNLSDYSNLNYESVTKTIDGTTTYVIQSPQSFSPYVCANLYKLGPSQSSECLIKNKETEITDAAFTASAQNDFYFSQTDFFDEKQSYAIVQNLNYKTQVTDSLAPSYRFPFADKYPKLYVQSKFETPLVFTQRSLTPVKQFDIGKKASAGSVRVYKNGVLLPGAVYDSNTGFVTLNETVGELDKIYIVYEEGSSDSSKGFVTTGAGYSYSILPQLVFDTSFTGQYHPGDSNKEISKASFSALTNALTYTGKITSAYEVVSTAIESINSTNSFVTKNEIGITVHNDDAMLQAVSQQGIAVDTANNKKSSDYVNTNLKGAYTLFGVQAMADAALSYLDLQTAGHSLTTKKQLFNFLNFGELYRFSKDESEKKDYIEFAVPDKIEWPVKALLSAQAYAKKERLSNKQNYKLQSSTTIKTERTSHSTQFNFAADEQTGLAQSNSKPQKLSSNYFISWYDISKNQFTNGEDNSVRNTSFFAQYAGSFDTLKLSPKISFELSGNNKNTQQKEFLTADTLKFEFPFQTTNNAFSFNLLHKGTIQYQNITSRNYTDDIKNIFSDQNDFSFYYTALPLYSLFDNKLKTKISNAPGDATNTMEYDFAWRRKLFNDIKDLYVPISVTAGISRDLTKAAKKTQNTYQIKTKVSSSFINLFGTNSANEIFDWYKQEEYSGFVQAIVKFSPDTKASPYFQLSTGELMTFYIQDSNALNLNTDFYLDNYINWSFKTSAAWNRKTNASLLLELTHLCWAASKELDLLPKVNDSISITLSTQNKIHKQIYSYMRSSEITFLTHFNLTSAAGISFGYEQKKTFRLGLNYEFGLKISF